MSSALDAVQPEPAETYRRKVGRFRERWYHDPLPSCNIADADTEWTGPSVSAVKKASGSDWSCVAIKRITRAYLDDPTRWADMDAKAIAADMRTINRDGLGDAASRGTGVHLIAEGLADGRPRDVVGDAIAYRASVQAFFADHQPKMVAAEFVCLHRSLHGVGYGGTTDGLVVIDGKRYYIDWKPRGEDSNHGAYPEEAAQLGAYWGAEYAIVGGARKRVADVDGGLIVSIKPDGYEVFPVDLEAAFEHFTAMHAWWVARRTERRSIGKPWTAETGQGPDRRDILRAKYESLDDTAQAAYAALGVDRDDLDAVEAGLRSVDPFWQHSEPVPLPQVNDVPAPKREAPEEGADVAESDVTVVRQHAERLDEHQRAWIGAIVTETKQAHASIHLSERPTVRRFEVARGLIAFAREYIDGGQDAEARQSADDLLRACVALAVGDDAWREGASLGAVVALLSAHDAAFFAQAVADLADRRLTLSFPNGRPHLAPAA